ncbi:glutamine amidotransferase [Salsuginibacillus halophilus]|uniref:Imidazole glycerol phosphate synthase subunit HisH n=1 Tax=Salsuginibacillus halophilus TaxID=517424 RepID=A0A2P8H954_9BACI|nr:imidazole glycerol phosphate synthase subunit HisH [Salsuginibacillus halophilus]PSL42763.1 glutamine amidotransferase [Salsuginibacillus halophilus]
MIGIIDYGMGNLHSVSKAMERLGLSYFISPYVEELKEADGLILPGVGSFKDAMNILEADGLAPFIREWSQADRPLLGICLGMQLLFEESEENGTTQGLNLLPGRVRRFRGVTEAGEAYKVPHMGWNLLTFWQPEHTLLQNTAPGHVYFVHSFVVEVKSRDILIATCTYDVEVPAVVGQNATMGTQFHPEKSSQLGMAMLENFGNFVAQEVKARG